MTIFERIEQRCSLCAIFSAVAAFCAVGCSPEGLLGGGYEVHPFDADVASLSAENSLYDNNDFIRRSKDCAMGMGQAQAAIAELGKFSATSDGMVTSLLQVLPGSTERIVGDRMLELTQVLTRRNCHYPDTYLLSAQIFLQLAQVPLGEVNGRQHESFVASLSFGVGAAETADSKRSRLAKLNSAVRSGTVALKIVQTDREAARPYMKFGYNSSGSFDSSAESFVFLFPTAVTSIRPQNDADLNLSYAEASAFAHWLLAQSRKERAEYLWSSVVVPKQFEDSVTLPAVDSEGNLLGGDGRTVSLREAIAIDLSLAQGHLQSVSAFCAGKDSNSIAAHLVGACANASALSKSIVVNQERLTQGFDFWGQAYLAAAPAHANRRFAAATIMAHLRHVSDAATHVNEQKDSLAQIYRLEGNILDGELLLQSKNAQIRSTEKSLEASTHQQTQAEASLAARQTALEMADDDVRLLSERQSAQLHSYVGLRSRAKVLEILHQRATEAIDDVESYRIYVDKELTPQVESLLANGKVALQREWSSECVAGVRRAAHNRKILKESLCNIDTNVVRAKVAQHCAESEDQLYVVSRECIARVETCPTFLGLSLGCSSKRQWNAVQQNVWSPDGPLTIESFTTQPNRHVYVDGKSFTLSELIDKQLRQPEESDCQLGLVRANANRPAPNPNDSKKYLANRRVCSNESLYTNLVQGPDFAGMAAQCRLEVLQTALAETHRMDAEDQRMRLGEARKGAGKSNLGNELQSLLASVNEKWGSYAEDILQLETRQVEKNHRIAELNILIDEMIADFNLRADLLDSWNGLNDADRRAQIDSHCQVLFAQGSAAGFPILRLVEAQLRDVQVGADVRARKYQVAQDDRSLKNRLAELEVEIQGLNAEILDREITLGLPMDLIEAAKRLVVDGSVGAGDIDAFARNALALSWKSPAVRQAEKLLASAAADRDAAQAGVRRARSEVAAQVAMLRGLQQEVESLNHRQDDRTAGRAAFAYPDLDWSRMGDNLQRAAEGRREAAAALRNLVRYALRRTITGQGASVEFTGVRKSMDLCRYAYAFADIHSCLLSLKQVLVDDSALFNFKNRRVYEFVIENPAVAVDDLDSLLSPGGDASPLFADRKRRMDYEFIQSLMEKGSAVLHLDPAGVKVARGGHPEEVTGFDLDDWDTSSVMLVSAEIETKSRAQLALGQTGLYAYRSGLQGEACTSFQQRFSKRISELPATSANSDLSRLQLIFSEDLANGPMCEQVRLVTHRRVAINPITQRFFDNEASLVWQQKEFPGPDTASASKGLPYGAWMTVAASENMNSVAAWQDVSRLMDCLETDPLSNCQQQVAQQVETRGVPFLGTWTFALGGPMLDNSDTVEKITIRFFVE